MSDLLLDTTKSVPLVNNRNFTLTPIDDHQPLVRIMWYRFLLIIIIFVTAAGNILVCLAIARERKLQNTTNYFLMSLAIADCLVAILVMPMGMIAEVLGHFPLPYYACIIFATMDVLCCTSSIWHMSTMSMDRYFTIRFPFRYGRNKTRRIMLLKIVAVWAISIAISSPVFVLGIVNPENVLSNGICAPNHPSFKLYGSVFAFYIPFLIIIATYALTMRSLRNVLVNKKKYNRERSRKQTFMPLAHIINQYAEIAQTIRRVSSPTAIPTMAIAAPASSSTAVVATNNTTPYTIITTTSSPTDTRTQLFPLNTAEPSSIHLANGNSFSHEHGHHLTISYRKASAKKKKRYHQQQALTINNGMTRPKNECDMSTVYEITEYSKSTSSAHDVTMIIGNPLSRRSVVSSEQTTSFPTKFLDQREEMSVSTIPLATSTASPAVNMISPLVEEEASSTTDMDSATETNDSMCMQITSFNRRRRHSRSARRQSILMIPWSSWLLLLGYILRYYIVFFPYRSRPLALTYPSSSNRAIRSLSDQSTSTSPICVRSSRYSRSIATQTNSFRSTGLSSIRRRKFSLSRTLLPSSSLFTTFFRPSSTPSQSRSPAYSSNSSAGSSYPHHSSGFLRQTESDFESFLVSDHRPRASSSSSGLLRSTSRHTSSHWYLPLRRRNHSQSRSAYLLTNPSTFSLRRHQTLTSTTNTNSSDSSSVFHRFNPRFFSTISNQQQQQQQQQQSARLRDAHIVAANERKALRVLMIIFCVFVTLWTPFFICTFISAVCDDCRLRISSNVWFSITWLGYSSSMANPFIYTIFSDVFRRAFTNILCCRANEPLLTRQYSTKFSYHKGAAQQAHAHQHFSHRRSPNYEYSGASTPLAHNHPTPLGGSDATIYINRCASDLFR